MVSKDSFQLAAADAIRTYFADRFKVFPQALLVFYIGGGDKFSSAQNIIVSIWARTHHEFKSGSTSYMIPGTFELVEETKTMLNYSDEKRTETVRGMLYAVMNNAIKKLDASRTNASK